MGKLLKDLVKKLKSNTTLSFFALVAGAVLPFAFAPFGYYWLAEISLVLLLFVWSNSSPKKAFWRGWLFGAAFFSVGVYWVYVSIYRYGNAPLVLALAILALLVAVMALYPALHGYLLNRFYPKNSWSKFVLAFPASWVVLEWIRGWFLSGFPWLFLGYSHIDAPLRGWATVFGVYGVSFLVAQTAGVLFWVFFGKKSKKILIVLPLLVATTWWLGGGFARVNWTKPVGEPIQVSLIQGNVDQDQKWKPEEVTTILNYYTFLTAKNYSSKIVVWPEAAIPTYPENVWLYLKLLDFAAEKNNTTILSGAPLYDKQEGKSYNGIIAFGADEGRYYKRQLVPFGEYTPLRFALNWLHKFVDIPMSDFASGSKDQVGLMAQNILIAPFVCYEIAYPCLALDYMPKAGLMVTVSDDSWFGESIASAQHLEIARMRSLEVGRYQLFATNTGISAMIDSHGKIISKTPVSRQVVLTEKVENLKGGTPWVSAGRYLWLPMLLLGLWWSKRK